jgi:hypothetical protein
MASALAGAGTLVAFAQQYPPPEYPPQQVPPYTTWQPGWNDWRYDRSHVMLGTVAGFTPYRLTIAHRDGSTQTIDLKPGTAIFPTGQTPSEGEHVAIVGYWSRGTFIADRLILRP